MRPRGNGIDYSISSAIEKTKNLRRGKAGQTLHEIRARVLTSHNSLHSLFFVVVLS